MIRLKPNEFFPRHLYTVLVKSWDGINQRLRNSVQLLPLNTVLRFLRTSPYLLESARIAENNLVGPQQHFTEDCRKLPGVDEVVRTLHKACSARAVRQALSATTKPLPSLQQQFDSSPNNRQRQQQRGQHTGSSSTGGKGAMKRLVWADSESGSDDDYYDDHQDDDDGEYQGAYPGYHDDHRGAPAEQALNDAWQRGEDRARSQADHARKNRRPQKGAVVTMSIEELDDLRSQASRTGKQQPTNDPATANHGSRLPVHAGESLDISGNPRLEGLFYGDGKGSSH